MRTRTIHGWKRLFLRHLSCGLTERVAASYAKVGLDKVRHAMRTDPDFQAEVDAARASSQGKRMGSW